jgi:hypothetical protein
MRKSVMILTLQQPHWFTTHREIVSADSPPLSLPLLSPHKNPIKFINYTLTIEKSSNQILCLTHINQTTEGSSTLSCLKGLTKNSHKKA